MGSVAPSSLVATPLPWISKGSPLPSLSLSTFPFFRALPEQVEEPWTFSVAPSTLVATPLPWISKGIPLPSLFLSLSTVPPPAEELHHPRIIIAPPSSTTLHQTLYLYYNTSPSR